VSRSANVLVVQSKPDRAGFKASEFRAAGYDVTTAKCGQEALLIAMSTLPDLVMVDQVLPDISGIDVCRRLKTDPRTSLASVIILGRRDDESERVAAFEVGADDVVAKPVSTRELMLRARAVLRRIEGPLTARRLDVGALELDAEAHCARLGGVEIGLTLLEFRLLWTLAARGGAVQTREALLQEVWGPNVRVELRTVDQHVKRLRTKLGRDGVRLETIRGIGYRFEIL